LCDEHTKTALDKSRQLFNIPTTIQPICSSEHNISDIQTRNEFPTALINNHCRIHSANTVNNNVDVKPPTSSTSVANLLLLLSSG
jgi:hypothetical protein